MSPTETYLDTVKHFLNVRNYEPASIEMVCLVTEAYTPRGPDIPLFGKQENFQQDVFKVLSQQEEDSECLMFYFLIDLMDIPNLMIVAETIFKRCWINLKHYPLNYLYEIWNAKRVEGDIDHLDAVMVLMKKHGFDENM